MSVSRAPTRATLHAKPAKLTKPAVSKPVPTVRVYTQRRAAGRANLVIDVTCREVPADSIRNDPTPLTPIERRDNRTITEHLLKIAAMPTVSKATMAQ